MYTFSINSSIPNLFHTDPARNCCTTPLSWHHPPSCNPLFTAWYRLHSTLITEPPSWNRLYSTPLHGPPFTEFPFHSTLHGTPLLLWHLPGRHHPLSHYEQNDNTYKNITFSNNCLQFDEQTLVRASS